MESNQTPMPNLADTSDDENSLNSYSKRYPWQDVFLKQVIKKNGSKEYLFALLEVIGDHVGTTDPSLFISEIFSAWSSQPYSDLNKHRSDVSVLMSHLAFLAEIRTVYECFNINSNYEDIVVDRVREVGDE